MYLYKEKEDGFWYYRFQFNKKTIVRSSKTTDKKLAKQVAEKHRNKLVLEQHTPVAANDGRKTITLGKALELHARAKGDLKSARTHKSHMDFIKSVLGTGLMMQDLSAEHAEQVVAERKKEAAAATALHTLNFLRGTWKTTRRLKYGVQEIEWPTVRVNNKRVRYLSDEEERRYMDALDPDRKNKHMAKKLAPHQLDGMQRTWDLGIALLDTGARLSELVYLKKAQVNLKTREIDLRRSKNHAMSLLGMTDRVYEIVKRRMKSPGDYVFGKLDGQPCSTAGVRVRKAITRAGLQDYRLHDSRHDNATKLIRNGATLQELQLLLGHSRIETTTRYAHLANGAVASKAVGILNHLRKPPKAE